MALNFEEVQFKTALRDIGIVARTCFSVGIVFHRHNLNEFPENKSVIDGKS